MHVFVDSRNELDDNLCLGVVVSLQDDSMTIYTKKVKRVPPAEFPFLLKKRGKHSNHSQFYLQVGTCESDISPA